MDATTSIDSAVTSNLTSAFSDVTPTEYEGQVTWSAELAIFMAVIACYGAAGNLFIIGAVLLRPNLRTRGNAFVINLAVADLIVTGYIMPLGIATSQYKLKPFSDVLCDFNAFLVVTTCGVSTQSLMLIAIERYFHVCRMRQYDRVFTPQLVAVYIVFAWLYTMAWSMQGWTGWTKYYYGHDYFLCLFYGPESMSYDVCLVVFGILLPLIVLLFCYISIYRVVQSSRKAIEAHKTAGSPNARKTRHIKKVQARERKFILMLVTIVVVFCVCWAPGAGVMAVSGLYGEDGVPVLAYTVTIWIALCNSALNSIIYGTMNTNFRRGYLQIATIVFCCCCRERRAELLAKYGVTSHDRSLESKSNLESRTNMSELSRSNKAFDVETEFSTLPRQEKTAENKLKY